jgi:hypothetical protein
MVSSTPLAPAAEGCCRLSSTFVLGSGEVAAEDVIGGRGGGQPAKQRKGQRGSQVQPHGHHRERGIGLCHGEDHRQCGGEVAVGGAALLHHAQGGDGRGEADEVDLQGGEDAHAVETEGLQRRRQTADHRVEDAAGFEQAHQAEHDDHDRQEDEEGQLDGRTASPEDDVDDHFHGAIPVVRSVRSVT